MGQVLWFLVGLAGSFPHMGCRPLVHTAPPLWTPSASLTVPLSPLQRSRVRTVCRPGLCSSTMDISMTQRLFGSPPRRRCSHWLWRRRRAFTTILLVRRSLGSRRIGPARGFASRFPSWPSRSSLPLRSSSSISTMTRCRSFKHVVSTSALSHVTYDGVVVSFAAELFVWCVYLV